MRSLAFAALLLTWTLHTEVPCTSFKPDPPITLDATLTPDGRVLADASSPLDAEIELSILDSPQAAPLHSIRAKRPRFDLPAQGRESLFIRATLSHGTARFTRMIPLGRESSPPCPTGTLKQNTRGEVIREFEP